MVKIPPEYDTVDKFLEELRAICGLKPHIFIVQRPKNLNFLEKSGLTITEVEEIIFNKLNTSHYKKGPEMERDRDKPEGIVYAFHYQWNEYQIYIKLKIITINKDRPYAICLSFHD
ncbi:hypothetical protein ACX8XN_08840 [Calditrichota bacterium GD2]